MKTQTISKSFKGQKFTAYIMSDEQGCMIDLPKCDRIYTDTLKEAKEIASRMLSSIIDDVKYS